jgi:GAF domain-containing protein
MINSFLGIPLLLGDRVIGTLTLVHREPGRFTEDERWQLNKLAGQASIAIDNAIQVKQREEVLKAQIRELKVEIDAGRINEEVDQITGSDYFQSLQAHAAKMRNRVYTKDRRKTAEPDSQPLDPASPVDQSE